MTYHDASTRFGDRAHFPSMGSQLPKHIPGRGPGICLLEESQANPYGNRWFRGTWNSRYRKVGTAQFRMRICFLWGKLLGWFSFAKEKSRLVNQNYLQCSEFAEIYWYLFDCNLAEIYLTKIFAWLNWPWLVFHPWKSRCSTRIFFRILVVGIGRWNHSRQVMPWWPSRLSEGFFPESSYVFCRLFGGICLLEKKRWHETPLGGIMLRVETNLNTLLGWSNPPGIGGFHSILSGTCPSIFGVPQLKIPPSWIFVLVTNWLCFQFINRRCMEWLKPTKLLSLWFLWSMAFLLRKGAKKCALQALGRRFDGRCTCVVVGGCLLVLWFWEWEWLLCWPTGGISSLRVI